MVEYVFAGHIVPLWLLYKTLILLVANGVYEALNAYLCASKWTMEKKTTPPLNRTVQDIVSQ